MTISLALNVNTEDNSISIDLAIESAHYFGLSVDEAAELANNITTTVRDNWEKLATKYCLSRGAIEYMRPAFSACY